MKILMILTSHDKLGDTGLKTGFWLEEFAAPYYVFKAAGAQITVASPLGGQPPLDPKSDEADFQTAARLRCLDGKDLGRCRPCRRSRSLAGGRICGPERTGGEKAGAEQSDQAGKKEGRALCAREKSNHSHLSPSLFILMMTVLVISLPARVRALSMITTCSCSI